MPETFRMNQAVLQICSKAIENLKTELVLNAGTGVEEVIGTGILVRSNDACLVCENDVRQEVVDNLTHKRILRQFCFRLASTAFAVGLLVAHLLDA